MSQDLLAFVDAAPSPFHAAAEAARRLDAAGFARLDERDAWSGVPPRGYVRRAGSLVAWSTGDAAPDAGFRLVAGHTDSPNLRVKPRPDAGGAGVRQVAVEVYGGVLLNSWLDRDLGLSGRAWVRGAEGPEERLFLVGRPVLRLPQLAIHLDRSVNDDGLKLDKQRHMAPMWALGKPEEGTFRRFLAAELGVAADDVLAWDAMCHDVQPSRAVGLEGEFLSAPRLDNLCSCWAGLRALLAHVEAGAAPERVAGLVLFDHEEVGSDSRSGAGGPVLADVVERLVLARGGGREDLQRARARSFLVSADMAHATHPNYAERHEPGHAISLDGGPVIKINANQRYATDAEGEALFQLACEAADVPVQRFVNRTDLACGSTIGPISAARLGMRVVDVGVAQLAMHSAREMCGARDPERMVRALTAFLALP